MLMLLKILPGVLFVLSSTLAFNKSFKDNKFWYICATVFALISGYLVIEEGFRRIW